MTEDILARLKHFAQGFTESELTGQHHYASGLRQRWEFGRELLPLRVGKKLPKTELARVEGEVGLSRRDIQHHLKFADRYPTKADCETAVTQYGSWRKLVTRGLYDKKTATPKYHNATRALKQIRKLTTETVPAGYAQSLMEQAHRLMASQKEAA